MQSIMDLFQKYFNNRSGAVGVTFDGCDTIAHALARYYPLFSYHHVV